MKEIYNNVKRMQDSVEVYVMPRCYTEDEISMYAIYGQYITMIFIRSYNSNEVNNYERMLFDACTYMCKYCYLRKAYCK